MHHAYDIPADLRTKFPELIEIGRLAHVDFLKVCREYTARAGPLQMGEVLKIAGRTEKFARE
jgi:hypothetical protein